MPTKSKAKAKPKPKPKSTGAKLGKARRDKIKRQKELDRKTIERARKSGDKKKLQKALDIAAKHIEEFKSSPNEVHADFVYKESIAEVRKRRDKKAAAKERAARKRKPKARKKGK
jgi:hypothetical protein